MYIAMQLRSAGVSRKSLSKVTVQPKKPSVTTSTGIFPVWESLSCWPLLREKKKKKKWCLMGLCVCVRPLTPPPRTHTHTRSIQQMDKKLSLCILIGHLRLLFGLPLGENRSHLITHYDNIITDVQTNKVNS